MKTQRCESVLEIHPDFFLRAEKKPTQDEVIFRSIKVLAVPLNEFVEEFGIVEYASYPKGHRILDNDFVCECILLPFDD